MRLKAQARDTGLPLVRPRKVVVFERLLARLLVVAPERWVLKVGLALEFRFGCHAHTTKDMDLGRQDDIAGTTADFIAVQGVQVDDYFVFAVEQTERLDALEGAAVRYHVCAELAGRLFDEVSIDVGFGDARIVAPDTLRGPDLLGFAGLPPVGVPALPLPVHIAEKVHAYTRLYGDGMRSNTRVKDLVGLGADRVDGRARCRRGSSGARCDIHRARHPPCPRRCLHPQPIGRDHTPSLQAR